MLAVSPAGWHNAGVNRAARPLTATLALLAFVLLTLALTWPMAAHFGSHVPGDGIDDPSLAWNLWWAKHALVDQPQNPFDVRWQFWPVGINLAFYTLTLLNGALGIPIQVAANPVVAYNVLLLSSFALSGLGAYLLCLDALRRMAGDAAARRRAGQVAALLGGALYAFAAPKLFYAALGQGNIASSQWIPFAMLYIVRAALPGGRARDAALAALFVALQAYAELTYATFLALFAAAAALWGLIQTLRTAPGSSTANAARLLGRFLLIALLAGLALTPMLLNMLPDMRAEGNFLTAGGGFADLFSADLAGYLLPTQLHPVFGDVIRGIANDSAPRPDGSHMPVNKGQQIYVGYVVAALAVVALILRAPRGGVKGQRSRGATTVRSAPSPALWRAHYEQEENATIRSEKWFWAVCALAFFVLTLGPSLRVLGHDLGLPLPFALVSRLPFFEGNRYPSRYSVMLLASLAPLVTLGALDITSRLEVSRRAPHAARLLLPVLLVAMLFEHLSTPLPLFDLRVPTLYARVAAEPGDFALLEMPPGWRNGARVAGKQDIVIMQQLWNQSAHGKRVLGGNTSRNPEFKFQYFSEDPTLARLIAQTNAADVPQHDALRAALAATPITDADRARARDWAAFTEIRYVMVHRDVLPAETEAALLDLLPLEEVATEGYLVLYRVTGDLTDPHEFAVGADRGRMALAEGWSSPNISEPAPVEPTPVFAQRREARLLLPLPKGSARIRLNMGALAPNQTATLAVDGRTMGTQPVPDAPGWVAFNVTADPARLPLSDVRLRFGAIRPFAELAQTFSRAGSGGLLVRSAGQETGDFGHIYLDGVEVSPNRRGYNLVALDGTYGRLIDRAAFDTHLDPAASAALAAWINALPAGTVVAGAARDEASMNLTDEAVAALNTLGVTGDLRGRFRWGHAFIGAKDDGWLTPQEALGGVRPAQVSFGLPLSEPQIAAQLFDVVIEPMIQQ